MASSQYLAGASSPWPAGAHCPPSVSDIQPAASPRPAWPTGPAGTSWHLYLEHFDVRDEGPGILELIEVGTAQGAVLMQLGNAAAVPLPLQRVLPHPCCTGF